jgi:hypothetical protein
MKNKLLIIIICILFVGTLQAQQKKGNVSFKLIEKGVIDSGLYSPYPDMSTQLTNNNKPRLNILSIFLSDDSGMVSNAIKFSRTGWIDFNFEFFSYYSTQVKFHYIFTGPEFWYFEDDTWSSLNKNTIYQSQLTSFDDWKLGTYKQLHTLLEFHQL